MNEFLRKLSHKLPNALLSPLLYLHTCGLPKTIRRPSVPDAQLLDKMAFSSRRKARFRLLVDVTHQVYTNDRSGIPRTVNEISRALVRLDQTDFAFEFVMILNQELYTARRFSERILNLEPGCLGIDRKITIQPGDQLLMLDSTMDKYALFAPSMTQIHQLGGTVNTVIYDILPIHHPDWFPEDFVRAFHAGLSLAVRASDALCCISRFTADDTRRWIAANLPEVLNRVRIDTFTMSAQLKPAGTAEEPIRPELTAFLDDAQAENAPLFAQVSIIQPRKGQDFALDVFEAMWGAGRQERLVYVGRKGWRADALYQRILAHPENGRRFLFVENANETELARVYGAATALISPSRGEGFGLPVVEAALRSLPVLLNDLPVYREIAGEGGLFFSDGDAESLIQRIDQVIRMSDSARREQSSRIKIGTWEEGAEDLLRTILAVAAPRAGASLETEAENP